MTLLAALPCRNELPRFLAPCIDHLRRFCDRILVLDDASDDGTWEWLQDHADEQLQIARQPAPRFYEHEGRARATLLDLTRALAPTHVLSIDADEFVSDGPALRALIEERHEVSVWSLTMREVWAAGEHSYRSREDGGWRGHESPLVWRLPSLGELTFRNRALAVGRVPSQIRALAAQPSGVEVLHVGWLDREARKARHARYLEHDGGRFHARAHLDSILWPARRVRLAARPWPAGLGPWRGEILERAGIGAAA